MYKFVREENNEKLTLKKSLSDFLRNPLNTQQTMIGLLIHSLIGVFTGCSVHFCSYSCIVLNVTPCLLLSSADNLCKQFGSRSGPTKCWAWSGSKLFDTLLIYLKEYFDSFNYEKKNQQTAKHVQLPSFIWVIIMVSFVWDVDWEKSVWVTHINSHTHLQWFQNIFSHPAFFFSFLCIKPVAC